MTLYKEMNYRRTAQLLRMTQPGVTQHIQYLEKEYGVHFFIYEGRTLRRTPEAEVFKRHLDSMLAEEQALRKELTAQHGLHLRVGATKTIGEFVLEPTVAAFLSDPAHSLDFIIDNTHNLLQLMEDQTLDFAVIEGVFDKTQYHYHLFQKEKFLGICADTHPFAGKVVPLQKIFDQTLLIREPGSGTRRLLEQAVEDHGFSLKSFRRVISLSNFSFITELLTESPSITFAYHPVSLQRQGLATFEVEDMHIEGEFNFVYTNARIAGEKIRQFFGET